MITVKHGKGTTEYGPGVMIRMDADEVCAAVDLWLHAQGIVVRGPRTTSYDGRLLGSDCEVYVDPSGTVLKDGVRFKGSGGTE